VSDGKHIFAIYVPALDAVLAGGACILSDALVVHRIAQVLRLSPLDQVILFDREQHATVQLETISKKKVSGILLKREPNKTLTPEILFLMPILKKEALSHAIYSAVEVGANAIQLVRTQKSSRDISTHELERLERVAIAASEQSKQFAVPTLSSPIKLEEAIEVSGDIKIFFDPCGQPASQVVPALQEQTMQKIVMFIGPEGDITQSEKALLHNSNWTFCALVPTILRSVQAVAVSLGIIRSMVRNKV